MRLPDSYNGPTVGINPLQAPRMPTGAPPNALAQLGGVAQEIGEGWRKIAEKEREEADTIRAEEQVNKLYAARTALIYGDQGALKVEGENVFKGDKPFVASYQAKYDEAVAALQGELANDNQRRKFFSVAGRLRNQVGEELMRHEAAQGEKYRDSVFQGVLANSAEEMARSQEIADPAERAAREAELLGRVRDNARPFLSRKGFAGEHADVKARELESGLHEIVIKRLLEADNPSAAKDYYEKNRAFIVEKDGGALRRQIEKDSRGLLVGNAAAEIWARLGPKADADPVNLDVMAREADKIFPKDPDGRKLLVAELSERQRLHDYSARERQNGVVGGIWKQVLDRAPLATIRKSREFRSLDGAAQADMIAKIESYQKRNDNDPAAQMAKFAQYWAVASDPQKLSTTSDAAIFAMAPTMGPELTKQLLVQKKNLLTKEDKVIEAKIDQDSFNFFAREAGLDVTPPPDSDKAKVLGELKYRLETIVDAEQRRHTPPRPLSRQEKDGLIKKLFTEVPVTVKQPWYLGGGTTVENRRLFEVQHAQNIAIPATERQTIVDALKRGGVANPTDAQIREGYIRLKQK